MGRMIFLTCRDDKARLGKKKKKEKKEKSQQKKSDKLLRPWYHSGDTWYKPADPSLQHVEGMPISLCLSSNL